MIWRGSSSTALCLYTMTAESRIDIERTTDALLLAHMAGWIDMGETLIANRGPAAVIERSKSIIKVYSDILLTINQKNPLLAQLIATPDTNYPEPLPSGIQNLWAFTLPRIYLAIDSLNAKQSLGNALADQQKIDPSDPSTLIAFFAHHLDAAGADDKVLFRALFNRDKLIDSEYGLEFDENMWSIRNHAPSVWEKYNNMTQLEKDRHGIADVRIALLEDISWDPERGHFEIPADDFVVDTLRPDIAAAIISPYRKYDRRDFPENIYGDKMYDAHIQTISRINKKIALYLDSLRD